LEKPIREQTIWSQPNADLFLRQRPPKAAKEDPDRSLAVCYAKPRNNETEPDRSARFSGFMVSRKGRDQTLAPSPDD
jgi:hypothetical protein